MNLYQTVCGREGIKIGQACNRRFLIHRSQQSHNRRSVLAANVNRDFFERRFFLLDGTGGKPLVPVLLHSPKRPAPKRRKKT